LQTIVIRS